MSLRQTDRGDKMRQVQIKDIVKAVGGKLVWGDENAAVTNVSTDSREVKTGTLFVPIIGERVDARGGAGAHLGREREGIGLPYNGAVRALDNVLIELSGACARHKAAPYAEIAAAEPVRAVAPRAEIARHANAPRVRRPYGERYAVGLCARAEELLRVEIRPVDPSLFRVVCIQGESPPFFYTCLIIEV